MRLPCPLLIAPCVLALLVLPVCWAAQLSTPSPANGPTQDGPRTLRIRGTVVDGVSGKPVARALVTSNDRRLATMTNHEGMFALEVSLEPEASQGSSPVGPSGSAPMLQIYLTAERPGYLPQQTRPVGVQLDSSAEAQPVQLKLMPAATVAGRISNAHNEAAHHVSVDLLSHAVNNGERTWSRVASHRTDAGGSFRFGNLVPGEYTVMTEEWRGDQPLPPQRDAITEQYPPVYLGDARDLASANRLQMHFGETVQANLALRTATYYPVTVPVTGNADGFVNVRIAGTDVISGFHLGYVANRHAVEGSLPNGTYGLELTSYPPANNRGPQLPQRGQSPERSYGSTSIHISGAALHAAPVALVTPAPITVRVHREFNGRDIPEHFQARVYLQPVEQGQPFVTGNSEGNDADEITLDGASPGQYNVHVEPSYGYAAQVRCGGVDLRAEKLVVDSGGSQPIDIVLRDDTATVDGTVRGDSAQPAQPLQPGRPAPLISFVVLTPVDGDGRFSMAGTGPDGQFSMPNVAPGRYRLFAIDGTLWDSPYRDPEALRSLQDKGVAVSVTANAKLQVEVPLLDPAALEVK